MAPAASPGSVRARLEKQRFGTWLRLAGLSFVGTALVLMALLIFQETPPAFEVWVAVNLALLTVCLLGSWLVSAQVGRQLLLRQHPELAEALRTAEALHRNPAPTPEDEFFRKQHLHHLEAELEAQPRALEPRWRVPVLLAVAVQTVWLAALWWVPGNPAFLEWRDGPLPEVAGSYRLLFPAYLERESLVLETLPDQLKVPRGTRLEVMLEDRPDSGDRSRLEVPEQPPEALQWLEQQGRWLAALTPAASGTLILDWERRKIPVEVVPDAAPELLVLWPKLEHIFDSSPLPVDLTATDDHALSRITLYYRVEQTGEVYREIIQAFESTVSEHQELYSWELSGTPLRAGDNVTAWMEATDRDTLMGPNVARSEEFQFTVESLKEFHERLLARLWEVDEGLRELLGFLDRKLIPETTEQERYLEELLERIKRDMTWDPLLSDPLKSLVRELQNRLEDYRDRRRQAGPAS